MLNRRNIIKWTTAIAGAFSLLYGTTLVLLLYVPGLTCCPILT